MYGGMCCERHMLLTDPGVWVWGFLLYILCTCVRPGTYSCRQWQTVVPCTGRHACMLHAATARRGHEQHVRLSHAKSPHARTAVRPGTADRAA